MKKALFYVERWWILIYFIGIALDEEWNMSVTRFIKSNEAHLKLIKYQLIHWFPSFPKRRLPTQIKKFNGKNIAGSQSS